ncbi:MAG: WD40 repeat domain-containing protein [Fimbriimonadaceae bacterium]
MIQLTLAAVLVLVSQDAMSGHTRDVNCVATSPDGKTVASGSTDNTVRLWSNGSSKAVSGFKGDVTAVAFSADGKWLAAGEMYKQLFLLDVAAGAVSKTFTDFDGRISSVAFSPDAKAVYSACADYKFYKTSTADGKQVATARASYQPVSVAVSPDGTLVVGCDDSGTVYLFDTELVQKATVTHADKARCVAFSPDGSTVVSAGGDGTVKLWKATASGLDALRDGPVFDALAAAFSPDGRTLALGTFDNLVVTVDVASGTVKAKHEKHERPVTGVAWSPDGKTLYSSSMDMTVRAWRQ